MHIAKCTMALICVGGAVAANAQSAVEIYGVVDLAVQRSSNGTDTRYSEVSSASPLASRLGFRGTEELGDGLKAQFVLEHGLNPDTGVQNDAARFWNRRATVALLGNWGEVRLGRDNAPTYQQLVTFDPFGTNGVAKVLALNPALSNQTTIVRADNAVQYRLPGGLGGLYGDVMVAFNESSAGATGNRYRGLRLGYMDSALNVAFAHGQTTVTPLFGGDTVKETFLGGSYNFNVIKLSLNLMQRKLGSNTRREIHLAGVVPVTAQDTVRFTAATYKNNSAASDDANLIGVGVQHDFSKRTAVYANAARLANKGVAAFSVGPLPAVAGQNSSGVELGIRHSF